MYIVGIVVLAGLACYVAFTAVDRVGIGSMVAPARVVSTSYRAAGKTYVTEIVNNRPLVVPHAVPEAYLVDLDIEGTTATAAVDKAVHDGLRPGEQVLATYSRTRLTGRTQVLDVQAAAGRARPTSATEGRRP